MTDTAQKNASTEQPLFRAIRGGKGYLAEDVDAYLQQLRAAYIEVEGALEATEAAQASRVLKAEAAARQMEEAEKRLATVDAQLRKEMPLRVEAEEKLQQAHLRIAELEAESASFAEKMENCRRAAEEQEKKMEEMEREVTAARQDATKLKNVRSELAQKEQELAAAHKELDIIKEQPPESMGGDAEKYLSILSYARAAADQYVTDVEQKMNQLWENAQTRADELQEKSQATSEEMLRTARQEAEKLIGDAKMDADILAQELRMKQELTQKKADELLRSAEERAEAVLTKARGELAKIRALIQEASREYLDLSNKKADGDAPL